MEARHKKELKALDTEKRAALKKIKGTAGKGKKAKELLKAAETEFDTKLKELQAKHAAEVAAAENEGGEEANNGGAAAAAAANDAVDDKAAAATTTEPIAVAKEESNNDAELERKQAKQAKARRKREKQREKELERQRQIEQETANAGPSPRDVENDLIRVHLDPVGLQIVPVAADGHCLYRAVAAQVAADDEKQPETNYQQMRQLCADTLEQHETDFAPFCEYTDDITNFAQYCQRVRHSADWGGHLELRVLSMALQRPMWIYSATMNDTAGPLVIEGSSEQQAQHEHYSSEPIRLSYHRNYYALGEHYNRVVVSVPAADGGEQQ